MGTLLLWAINLVVFQFWAFAFNVSVPSTCSLPTSAGVDVFLFFSRAVETVATEDLSQAQKTLEKDLTLVGLKKTSSRWRFGDGPLVWLVSRRVFVFLVLCVLGAEPWAISSAVHSNRRESAATTYTVCALGPRRLGVNIKHLASLPCYYTVQIDFIIVGHMYIL